MIDSEFIEQEEEYFDEADAGMLVKNYTRSIMPQPQLHIPRFLSRMSGFGGFFIGIDILTLYNQ